MNSILRSTRYRGNRYGFGFLVIATIAFAGCPPAFALSPDKSLSQYICRAWNAQNGFPSYEISSIQQTQDGFIWMGTRKGLIRYDGLEFKLLTLPMTRAFQYSEISALACSADRGLWLGIQNGTFAYYSPEKGFKAFTNEAWIDPRMNVKTLFETSDGALWIGSTPGAFRWTGDGKVSAFTNISECCSIFEDSHHRVWLGSQSGGLYCWSNGELGPDLQRSKGDESAKTATTQELATQIRSSPRAITEDKEGEIWIGASDGLRCFDSAMRQQGDVRLTGAITRLLVDSHGILWVGTSEGLFRYKDGSFTSIRRADGLADDYVTALFEDRDGNLWVGGRIGLSVLSDAKLPLFSEAEGLWKAWNLSVCPSANGGLWAGTSAGVSYWDGKTNTQTFSKQTGLSSDWIKRVLEAKNGDVYLLNGNREVEILREGKVIARHAWQSEWPTGITEDSHGVLVSFGGQLVRVSVDKIEPYDFGTNAKPKFDWINNLGLARDDSILVCTVNGLFRVKDDNCQRLDIENGLPSHTVLWACDDEHGAIWVGTAGGLAHIKGTRVRSWTREEGLLDNFIRAVIPDGRDRLWVQSSQGIFSLNKVKLEAMGEVECIPYDGPEAVKTTDTREVEYSACKTRDGRIWFPSPEGLIMVDPESIVTNFRVPSAHIETVRANAKYYDRPERIVVAPGQGELEVQFTAPTFVTPQKQQFRYKLEGYQSNWEEAGTRRSAFFTNLKPGKYKFQVQACGKDGTGGAVNSLEIELLPFFYQTKWFYLLCVAISTTVLAAAYSLRVRALKHRQERLETEVRNRTAELSEKTVLLEKEIEEREQVQRKLLETSRLAGMAEVATGVLHNVGNVLNSVNVSTTLLMEQIRNSKVTAVGRVAQLLKRHDADLGGFLNSDPKGRQLPGYLDGLSNQLAGEQTMALQELTALNKHIDHIKQIVAMQQSYAKVAGVTTTENVIDLIEDALRMNEAALERHRVLLVRDYQQGLPQITVDRHRVMQILLNLIRNAKYACDDSEREDKQITVRAIRFGQRMQIAVIDNGIGIPAENLSRIFSHGFTTRKNGHGFGLHSGALAAKEMGGELRVSSDGPGKGATFVFELPLRLRPDSRRAVAHVQRPVQYQ